MTASRRFPRTAVSAVSVLLLRLGAARVHAAASRRSSLPPEFGQIHTSLDQKHTPKIVAPESSSAAMVYGDVSVGAGDSTPRCPSTSFATSRCTRTPWRSRASISIRCTRSRR